MNALLGKDVFLASFPPHKRGWKWGYLYSFAARLLWLIIILFLFLNASKIRVYAVTASDLHLRIKNLNEQEMEVTCINPEKRYYEVFNPTKYYISTIEGLMPEGFTKVKVRTGNKLTYTSDTYPDLYFSYDISEGRRQFFIKKINSISSQQFDCTTHGVFELIFYNDDDNETLSYFVILNGEPYNSQVANGQINLFSDRIDLVNPSTNEVLYNVFDKEIDSEVQPARKLYQKVNISDFNTDKVAIKASGHHNIPESYSQSAEQTWINDGEKYFRINGGEWIRFSEVNDDRDFISPYLELEEGDNLVEVFQIFAPVLLMKNDLRTPPYCIFPFDYALKSLSHVLLIHCDKPTISSKDSSTNISQMNAYSWAQIKGDLFIHFQTNVDEERGIYNIILSNDMKYTPVIFAVDTENPGAVWSIEDADGQDIDLGRIGNYIAFDSEGRSEIYIRVTSADGTKTSVKKVQLLDGEYSSKTDLTGLRFDVEDIKLISKGQPLSKTDNYYSVDSSIKSYIVSVNADSFQLGAECIAGASVSIDGEKIEPGQMATVFPQNKGISEITVTASDGMTKDRYYLLYEYKDTYPYFGVSDSTRQLADSMLTGFREYLKKENMQIGSDWWATFMAKSVGASLDGAYVFDVRTKDYNILSDYACAALELIAIGENPYDFEGVNYIQETENCLKRGAIGAWDTTLWALIAFKAAGYDYPDMEKLVTKIKGQAWTRISGISWSIDTGSWAWEATKDEFSLENQAEWSQWIYRENQRKTGDEAGIFEDYYYGIPNSNTHGCVLSALNALNIDPEKFAVAEGKSPLLTLKDQYMFEDGRFRYNNEGHIWGNVYNKDIIVALGDIVAGESLWDRITVTSEMMDSLIQKAQSLEQNTDEKQKEILQEALQKAIQVTDITKEGKAYFDLQDAIRSVDKSALPTSRICSPEVGTKIDILIEKINHIGEVTEKNADDILKMDKEYEALNGDIEKRYVSNYSILADAVIKAQKIKDNLESTKQSETTTASSGVGKETAPLVSENMNLSIQSKSSALAIKLSWRKISGVKGYDIFRYNSKTKKYKKIATLKNSSNSYTVKKINGSSGSKLKDGTKYTFKVSAYVVANGVKKYNITSKIATATAPQKVAKIAVKGKGKRNVAVSWKPSKRCSGYEIWAKTQGSKYKRIRVLKKKTASKAVLSKLRKNKKYSIKIRAYITVNKKKIYGAYSKPKTILVK